MRLLLRIAGLLLLAAPLQRIPQESRICMAGTRYMIDGQQYERCEVLRWDGDL